MTAPRRIGILTGGGDVPGLNSVIKSVVYRAAEMGAEVVGIRRGWQGLTHVRRSGVDRTTSGRWTRRTPGRSIAPAGRSSTRRGPTRADAGEQAATVARPRDPARSRRRGPST